MPTTQAAELHEAVTIRSQFDDRTKAYIAGSSTVAGDEGRSGLTASVSACAHGRGQLRISMGGDRCHTRSAVGIPVGDSHPDSGLGEQARRRLCATGEQLHENPALSFSQAGRTHIVALRPDDVPAVQTALDRYQQGPRLVGTDATAGIEMLRTFSARRQQTAEGEPHRCAGGGRAVRTRCCGCSLDAGGCDGVAQPAGVDCPVNDCGAPAVDRLGTGFAV